MSVAEALETRCVLDRVRQATLLEAIGLVAELGLAARADDPTDAGRILLAAVADGSDELTAIAAVHGLGALADAGSGEVLASLLDHEKPFLRMHAAWSLGARPVVETALPGLADMVAAGGFAGTVAQATLESGARQAPDPVGTALLAAATASGNEGARMRLVETLGLVPGEATVRILHGVAADDRQAEGVRAAALAALGDVADPTDASVRATLDAVVAAGGPLGDVAATACSDLDQRQAPTAGGDPVDGLAVAQLFLHADIDGSLLRAGQGDTGGIATLLVHLGDALLAEPGEVRRVVTISRGRPGDALGLGSVDRPGHHYLPVPIWGPRVPAAEAWPLRVPVRRAMRRILARAHVDVLHLRMADVASWAGAEAARDLGVPVLVTVAPDPHAMVAARAADGTLTRQGFGAADHAEHLVFRVRLLRELQEQAAHLVAFPRPALETDLHSLLGLDLATRRHRVTVVPEGIDLVPLDRAAREVHAAARGETTSEATVAALDALDALLRILPPRRRRLPMALTVGRLHRVKGMATLTEAWVSHPDLAERCNLVVVGGDLERPTADEQEQLARIDGAVARPDGPGTGLLLAGHRPNATVAVWLAAARTGRPGLCAPGGVYVSASLKEEFGIAILEAMASGLVVVAPWEGGPATYVDDGVTGVLADTRSPAALADAIGAALDLTSAPGAESRADQARTLVRDRFSIQTMAAALSAIYQDVTR